MKQISKSFSNFYVLCSVLGARCSVFALLMFSLNMRVFAQSDCSSVYLNPNNTHFDNGFLPDCNPVQGNFIVEHINKVSGPVNLIVSVDVYFDVDLTEVLEQEFWTNFQVNLTSSGVLESLTPFNLNDSDYPKTSRRFPFRQVGFTYNYPNGTPFQAAISVSTPDLGLYRKFEVRVIVGEEGCPLNIDNQSSVETVNAIGNDDFPVPISGSAMALTPLVLSNLPSSQPLTIHGNLDFDRDFQAITGAPGWEYRIRYYLSEGSSITIKNGKTLNLRNVDIFTCDHLAHGIIVEPGGTLIADEVNFRDSRFAIDARPGSKIDIRNSHFQNNYLGLNAQLAPGDAPIQLLGFANNTFTTTDGIKLPYAGMPEQVGAVGFAGIRAENNNDFNSWSPNTFNNLANGILLRNSNANLDNLTMTNMVADAAYPVSGFGVNTSSDNNTSFLILGRHGVSSFNGVGTAVAANRIGGEVSNCQITDAETGIRWQNSPNRDKLLLNNNITAKVRGIDSYRCEPNIVEGNFNSRMENNTINAPQGIRANESSSGLTGKGWRIFDNNITSSGDFQGQFVAGIFYAVGRNGWVNDNTVTTSGANARGIDGVFLKKSTISANNITGTNDINNIGILLRNNTDLLVECNTPTKSQLGIRLTGPNGGTHLKTNRFAQLTTGLEYGSSAMQTAFTGEQVHHGNVWYNGSITLGAKHWETPSNSAVMSRFIVDIPESLIYIDPNGANKSFMPSTREPMFDWFQNEPDDTLSAYCPIPLSGVPATPGSEWHTEILNGTYQPSIFKEAQLFKLRSDVMQKITEQPVLTLGNTVYQNFESAYSGSVLQKLGEASVDKNTLFDMSGVQSSNWLAKYELMRAKSDALAILDKQQQAGVVISTSLYNQKKQEYAIARQAFEQLSASINSQKSIMAGAYKAENGLINPSTIWETNQKVVNDIQFRLAQTNQELTGQEMKTLEPIAMQCPLLGGDAVFEARALLGFRTDLYYDDDTQCQADIRNNVQNREGAESSKSSSLVIYPNPSSGHILLDAYMGKRLLISDVYGRVFMDKDILSPRVDVSHLPSGIYQVCVSDAFTRLMCGNLMVTDK